MCCVYEKRRERELRCIIVYCGLIVCGWLCVRRLCKWMPVWGRCTLKSCEALGEPPSEHTSKPLVPSVSRSSPEAHPGSNTMALSGLSVVCRRHPTKARLASMDYEARNPKNNKDQNKTVLLVKFISNSNHLDDPSAHSSSGMICSGLGPVDTARESGCLRGEEVAKGRVCPLPKPHTGESMAAIISFPGSQWKRKEAALEPGSA